MGKNKKDKEAKLEKKKQMARRKEEREAELKPVLQQLSKLGLNRNIFTEIDEFLKIVESFIETGNPFSGRIKVEHIGREIQYLLNNNKKHQICVVLKNLNT